MKNFKDSYNEILKSIKTSNDNFDNLRVEFFIESLKDWSEKDNLESIRRWFIDQQKDCKMNIEDIPLSDCRGWSFNKNGSFSHDSGEFFYLQGLRVTNSEAREVETGWDQPIVTQVGFNGGILGILRKKFNNIPYYLLEAKAEPGNPDIVQISPTLQATFSNLKQAHGGKKPKMAEFFEFPDKNKSSIIFDQWMSEDGGRLHLKRNKGMLIEVNEDYDLGKLDQSFKWFTLYQIKSLIKENSWVGPHVRSIISHL